MKFWKPDTEIALTQLPYYKKNEKYDNNIFTLDIEVSSGFIDEGSKEVKPFDLSLFPDIYNSDIKKRRKAIKECDEYYNNKEKVALCYMWQMGINEEFYYGRSLFDLPKFIENIENILDSHFTIWVHNLAYEFEFLLNVFKFDKIFARKAHKVIYADVGRCRFRCSYFLTRLSLKAWGKKVGVKKLTEIMDYNIIRTPKSILDKNIILYGITDVKIMYYGLLAYLKEYGTIENIPLTQTGEVRRDIKNLYKNDYNYHKQMTNLIPKTWADYNLLKKAYWGAITHGNRFVLNMIKEDVESWDLSSSYIACLCMEKFPYTYFTKVTNNMFKQVYGNDDYSFIIDITFYNIKCTKAHTYISVSKIEKDSYGIVPDNGRILSAEKLHIILTNVDMECIDLAYSYDDNIEIHGLWIARNAYLDVRLIEYALSLYRNKTSLKNIGGMEEIYNKSKEKANALYGMAVMDIIQKNISYYHGEWKTEDITPEKYNEKVQEKFDKIWNNFNAYQFGIYIAAYARRNLWLPCILIDKDDFYMDTDSHKCAQGYRDIFKNFNENVERKIQIASTQLNISSDLYRAQDKDGITHVIGYYEYEGTYKKFKTLGAKRYAYTIINKEGKEEIHITVSGVNKELGSTQLKSLNDFNYQTVFDYDHSGKLQLTYNSNMPPDIIWNKGQYDEYISNYRYGISVRPSTYSMSPIETSREEFKNLLLKTIIERLI